MFALIKLRFIIFLRITNRAVYIESTRLYMSGKRRRERKPREKGKESMHSINDSDERAHTLRRYLNDRFANERNVDIQCYVFNNDRQAMYHHYQRHLHYNCYMYSIRREFESLHSSVYCLHTPSDFCYTSQLFGLSCREFSTSIEK